MAVTSVCTTERLANYFVSYLFDTYRGSRHIRRVATWIGFLLKAIERVAGGSLRLSKTRQILFDYRGIRYKACFRHDAGARGGIMIVEVLPGRGAPEGDIAMSVTSLEEAEEAYLTLEERLDQFIAKGGEQKSLWE
jgi:hypothetical protein